ncbi:IMPACT family protein [Myroides sp. LJL119]
MNKQIDSYKTINQPTQEVLYKEKNSKFFAYAFPITSEQEVKPILDQIKKQHYNARHWCYAFQLGAKQVYYRVNDDGEPSNTAGAPIYGQIQSFELTDVLVVVVRYFGGIKLGVGGLITAYRAAAQLALEQAQIVDKTIDEHFKILFQYKDMNNVMRIIKEKDLEIVEQQMHMSCCIEVKIRLNEYEKALASFEPFYEVKILTPDMPEYNKDKL